MEEIFKLAKNLVYSGEVVTDDPEITEDQKLHRKEDEQTPVEN